MPFYLMPPVEDASAAVHTMAQRSKTVLVKVDRLYQLGPYNPPPGVVIAMINEEQLRPLVRFADEFVTETPSAVLNVPGAVYSVAWHTLTATLPHVEWSQLEAMLAKSGLLAADPVEVAKRSSAAAAAPEATVAGATLVQTNEDRWRERYRAADTPQRSAGDDDDLSPDQLV